MAMATTPVPRSVLYILSFGSLLSLLGGLWILKDLYSGTVHGVFYLVRGTPVTADGSFRHYLTLAGEALGVFVLTGVAVIFAVAVFQQIRKSKIN